METRKLLLATILTQFCIKFGSVNSILATAYPQIELCSGGENSDPDRTAFHFQPAKNWLNDPNGPMYHKGLYHLFYQYNPSGPLWGNLSWAHSISVDLVNWEALPLALLSHSSPFDLNGCWSGSATLLPAGSSLTAPVMLYTGIDDTGSQVQNVAFPRNGSDAVMREWVKPGYNPVMPLDAGLDPDKFRDPTTAWRGEDGEWRTAIAAEVEGTAEILLYTSKDFVNWKRKESLLHESQSAGMWECPDFFPVSLTSKQGLDTSVQNANTKHVLKISLMKTLQDYYLIGNYDRKNDLFVTESDYVDDYRTWFMMDYGHIYAAKSFFDGSKNRRIVWAWVNESDSESDDVKRGWSGIQTLPREIWLDDNGKQLVQWPIEEIESLRKEKVSLENMGLKYGEMREITGVSTLQTDVEIVFEIPSLEKAETFNKDYLLDPSKLCKETGAFEKGGIGPFGIFVLSSEDISENTPIFFRIYKYSDKYMILMCSDLSRSSEREGVYKPAHGGFVGIDITKNKTISLRTLVDHSVVESYAAGGRMCMTTRVYPKHVLTGQTSHLYVFNNGYENVKIKELNAWQMQKARVNIENDKFISVNYI